MKARLIRTDEIVDVIKNGYIYIGMGGTVYCQSELEFNIEKEIDWEKRKFELAKAALQGLVSNHICSDSIEVLVSKSITLAKVMVEKLKNSDETEMEN